MSICSCQSLADVPCAVLGGTVHRPFLVPAGVPLADGCAGLPCSHQLAPRRRHLCCAGMVPYTLPFLVPAGVALPDGCAGLPC